MIEQVFYAILSVFLISVISFIGIVTLAIKDKSLNKILLYLVAFSAGALLGDTFIHLIPEVVEEAGFTINVSIYILLGILSSFAIEKIVHWRHCHIPTSKEHPHPFAYMNLFGDAVHNFIDGMIIAGSYLLSIPVGIATTIAVLFHEIPQEIGDFGVLIHGGFKKKKAIMLNFLSAVFAVFGAVFAIIISGFIENSIVFLTCFAAGSFLYIASSDLIPELNKNCYTTKSSLLQLVAIVLGIAIMYSMIFLE